jgi:hypothetical protein
MSKELEAIMKLRDLRERLRIEIKVAQHLHPSHRKRLWRHMELVDEVLALLVEGDEEAEDEFSSKPSPARRQRRSGRSPLQRREIGR